MLPNPDFNWKQQPQIKVWCKKADKEENSSVKLEIYGPSESITLFEEALKHNEVPSSYVFLLGRGVTHLSKWYLYSYNLIKPIAILQCKLRFNKIGCLPFLFLFDWNVKLLYLQLNYDGKTFALPFNFSILKWAAGTRQILNSARLPDGVRFYNIYGTSFDTPFDVWYAIIQLVPVCCDRSCG